jgi:futalosine hydrolase
MTILIVSATDHEIKPMLETKSRLSQLYPTLSIHFLITGVGIPATIYQLTRHLLLNSTKPQLIINVGLAGAFNKDIKLATVHHVVQDCFGDLGAEEGNRFLDLIDLNLQNSQDFPFQNGVIYNTSTLKSNLLNILPKARAITVNTVTGSHATAKKRFERFRADLETMEGCACFMVATLEQIPIIQLRAVSNYIERRNKKNWQIPQAIHNLNKTIMEFLNDFSLNYGN